LVISLLISSTSALGAIDASQGGQDVTIHVELDLER
jgi:hypothetical protein